MISYFEITAQSFEKTVLEKWSRYEQILKNSFAWLTGMEDFYLLCDSVRLSYIRFRSRDIGGLSVPSRNLALATAGSQRTYAHLSIRDRLSLCSLVVLKVF